MRTTRVLSITMPEEMLRRARKRAKKENRTMSEFVREAIRQYEDMRWLREMQVYGEERAKAAGILTEQDVERMIHEHRAQRRSEKAQAS